MRKPASESNSHLIARIDGASRGNPGPAAYAVVLERKDGAPVERLAECIGTATNNVAEYRALLAALGLAGRRDTCHLKVFTDSELLARQILGRYKVKSPDLKPLFAEAQRLIAGLAEFSIQHVPREENREADRLANQALDGQGFGH